LCAAQALQQLPVGGAITITKFISFNILHELIKTIGIIISAVDPVHVAFYVGCFVGIALVLVRITKLYPEIDKRPKRLIAKFGMEELG
jgi:hypothetical protein